MISVTLFLFSQLLCVSYCALQAVILKEKFPIGPGQADTYIVDSFYNEKDLIFVVPTTYNYQPTFPVLEFNLTSETIRQRSYIQEYPNVFEGDVLLAPDGDILFLGANRLGVVSAVLKTNLDTNVTTNMGALPFSSKASYSGKRNMSSTEAIVATRMPGALIFKYNLQTFTGSGAKDFIRYFYSRAIVHINETLALMFVSDNINLHVRPVEINVNTLEYKERNDVVLFPGGGHIDVRAVYDGCKYVYIIGGIYPETELPNNGLVRLDVNTMKSEFIQVDGFFTDPWQYIVEPPNPVYVEKLQRIYFFGGLSERMYNDTFYGIIIHDDIWYIQLEKNLLCNFNVARTFGILHS